MKKFLLILSLTALALGQAGDGTPGKSTSGITTLAQYSDEQLVQEFSRRAKLAKLEEYEAVYTIRCLGSGECSWTRSSVVNKIEGPDDLLRWFLDRDGKTTTKPSPQVKAPAPSLLY